MLELPDEDLGTLAVLLWRSLEPDDGEEVTGKEWEAIWAAEIERRMCEVAEGKVELVDGDQVDAEIQTMLAARRRQAVIHDEARRAAGLDEHGPRGARWRWASARFT